MKWFDFFKNKHDNAFVVGASLDGDGTLVDMTGEFQGVSVLEVGWVLVELDTSVFPGFEKVGVRVFGDRPDESLRHD